MHCHRTVFKAVADNGSVGTLEFGDATAARSTPAAVARAEEFAAPACIMMFWPSHSQPGGKSSAQSGETDEWNENRCAC